MLDEVERALGENLTGDRRRVRSSTAVACSPCLVACRRVSLTRSHGPITLDSSLVSVLAIDWSLGFAWADRVESVLDFVMFMLCFI